MPRIIPGNTQPFIVLFWQSDGLAYPSDTTGEDAEIMVRGYSTQSAELSIDGEDVHKMTGSLAAAATALLAPGVYDCQVATETLGTIEGRIDVWRAVEVTDPVETNATIQVDVHMPSKIALSWSAVPAAFSPSITEAYLTPDPPDAGDDTLVVNYETDIPATSISYKWYYTWGQ